MAKKRGMMIGIDGADPFVIDRMIANGELPNFKRAEDEGVWNSTHAMIGVLPSVTPPNWCTLGTGNWPRTHGVTCFFNHTLGKPLDTLETNWDSRRVESEFIWERFSKEGKKSVMLNYCEAWPPRFEDPNGIYIDGTGVVPFSRNNVDFQKLITLRDGDFETVFTPHVIKESSGDCVVDADQYDAMLESNSSSDERSEFDKQFDPVLDIPAPVIPQAAHHPNDDVIDKIDVAFRSPENWSVELPASAKVAPYTVNDGLVRRYMVVFASDGVHYDTVQIYANRNSEPMCTVKNKEWAWPVYDSFTNSRTGEKVRVAYGVRPVTIAEDGSFAEVCITHALNVDDVSTSYPREVGVRLIENVGPCIPFLKFARYTSDCNDVLLESFQKVIRWHADSTKYLLEKECPDWDLFYIHIHPIDLFNHWFLCDAVPGACDHWELSKASLEYIYKCVDEYVGMILDTFCDENTSVFFTSDHAAVPESIGEYNPGLGGLDGVITRVMEDLGFTVTKQGADGKLEIDWGKTRAVSQRSTHIYVNLKGRDPNGIVEPEDYKATVDEIIEALYAYRHPETGHRVVSFCLNREEMEFVGMGGEHCGDILFELMPTYNMEHAFSPSTISNEGYSMQNLCLMVGGDFKKGGQEINRVVRAVDVVPTLCHVTETPVPGNVEGAVIWQALEGFDEPKF